MHVSPEFSGKIQAALKEFVGASEPYILNFDEPIDLRKVAAELEFLPMLVEWSGCYAIRPDGEIVVLDFDQDEPYEPGTEADMRICRMVLYQGAKKYPKLIDLVPPRPIDAEACLHCEGTGIEPMNVKLGFEEERIICWCGGLGWLPKEELQLRQT